MNVDAEANLRAILASQSFVLAERDIALLSQPELRPVRMQLELLKPEMALAQHQVKSTIVVFGGTKIWEREAAERRLDAARCAAVQAPGDPRQARAVAQAQRLLDKTHYYAAARTFTQLISALGQADGEKRYVVVTGGGPGVMEAANRGAYDVGAKSVGLNILMPAEQRPNPYITPELCFQFHYFALRKLHFLLRAKGLVVFPGGFGTIDELFDALTLRQTGRMQPIPIVMYGREYWERVIDFQFLADEGVIDDEDLEMIEYAETPEEAVAIVTGFKPSI